MNLPQNPLRRNVPTWLPEDQAERDRLVAEALAASTAGDLVLMHAKQAELARLQHQVAARGAGDEPLSRAELDIANEKRKLEFYKERDAEAARSRSLGWLTPGDAEREVLKKDTRRRLGDARIRQAIAQRKERMASRPNVARMGRRPRSQRRGARRARVRSRAARARGPDDGPAPPGDDPSKRETASPGGAS